jgi:Spy/CpxP family protein refolding chaperone
LIRVRTILIGMMLLLIGGAIALAVEHAVVRGHPPGSPAMLHATLLDQMDSTLQLTAAQRDSIHAIFLRHQSLVDSVWRSMNDRMQATMDSVHRELIRVLEPGQREALHEWIGRHRGETPRR